MSEGYSPVPQSTEVAPAEPETIDVEDSGQHMGAVDGETTPVRTLTSGPDEAIADDNDAADLIDPVDELTPG